MSCFYFCADLSMPLYPVTMTSITVLLKPLYLLICLKYLSFLYMMFRPCRMSIFFMFRSCRMSLFFLCSDLVGCQYFWVQILQDVSYFFLFQILYGDRIFYIQALQNDSIFIFLVLGFLRMFLQYLNLQAHISSFVTVRCFMIHILMLSQEKTCSQHSYVDLFVSTVSMGESWFSFITRHLFSHSKTVTQKQRNKPLSNYHK